MNEKTPMMGCGHAANATSNGKPCCVICLEDPKSRQIVEGPDLTGRMAKCSYGDTTVKSSTNLAFFKYKGDGSQESLNKCECGYWFIGHLPYWEARIKVVRRWFKIENNEDVTSRRFHATKETKDAEAEIKADFFRAQMGESHREETRVKSVEILDVLPTYLPGGRACKKFTPVGPQEHDEYYCGCHGWD
jgi:hypothetical protein